MNKLYVYILVSLLIITVLGYSFGRPQQTKKPAESSPETQEIMSEEEVKEPNQGVNELSDNQAEVEAKVSGEYFYPINNYNQRVSIRSFSKSVKAGDEKSLDCGAVFSGFHTADDLEVIPSELNREVKVYAITDGLVKKVETVTGYGGLIVITHELEDQKVTAYYGHLDLKGASVQVEQKVEAGQPLANLGDHCSSETANERKHLHFGIHKGNQIDIRGYVDSESELNQWLNPKITFEELQAQEPKSE